ncbi:MAG TPA: iron-sulfur cluster insertion protein ErpA [Bdellovibrionota bacterium]|nr:iron-sulfur cluster insertion protein ErpA [Bdellovibrionota bacterium]
MLELTITEKAIEKVKTFAAADKSSNGKGLRIYVQGGGCSGFQYGFAFDDQQDGDTVLEKGEIKVLVDPHSAPYLAAATVDYVEDFRGSGFVVNNPNAKGTCGCGSSFTV